MKKLLTICAVIAVIMAMNCPAQAGTAFNGQSDNQIDSDGYYYAITGGLFPTGTTPNGDNATGGTFRYILDAPEWNIWYGPSSAYDLGY